MAGIFSYPLTILIFIIFIYISVGVSMCGLVQLQALPPLGLKFPAVVVLVTEPRSSAGVHSPAPGLYLVMIVTSFPY